MTTFYVQLLRHGKPVTNRKLAYFSPASYGFNEVTGIFQMNLSNDAPIYFEVTSDKWYHKNGLLKVKADTARVTDFDNIIVYDVPLKNEIKTLNKYAVRIRTHNLKFPYPAMREIDIQSKKKLWDELKIHNDN